MIEIIDWAADLIIELLILPLVNDDMYRRGFLVALLTCFTIGQGAGIFLRARAQIHNAFASYSVMNAQAKLYKYSDR